MSFCFPLQDRMFIKTSIRINLLWYVRLYLLFWWVICITFNYILLQYIINGTPLASFFFSRYKKEWTEMKRELGIISFELMTFTTSRWHSTTELYPFPILIQKGNCKNFSFPKNREIKRNYIINHYSSEVLSCSHTLSKPRQKKNEIILFL